MNERTFNKLLWAFHRELKRLYYFSDETIKNYLSCIGQYRSFCREPLEIDILQTKQEHLFEFMLDLRKRLNPSRITHFRAALRRFFRMLYLYGEIQSNPATNLLPVRRKKPTRYNYIPADEILALIDTIDPLCENENRDKLMILMLWCLGLRSLEMRSVKKEDIKIIDSAKKCALLNVHGKVTSAKGAGAKERALLIMDTLFDQLREYIKPFKDNELIFPGKDGKLMHDTTVNRRIGKYAAAAGIRSHITAHCLRHSFATEIRIMMGHENLRETSAYIHISQHDMSASLNLLTIMPDGAAPAGRLGQAGECAHAF
jgi:site-specific recombinase XerD